MQLNATGEIRELNISIPVSSDRDQWDQIIDKAIGIIMFVGGNNLSNSEFLDKLESYEVI